MAKERDRQRERVEERLKKRRELLLQKRKAKASEEVKKVALQAEKKLVQVRKDASRAAAIRRKLRSGFNAARFITSVARALASPAAAKP